ncbi:MAG: sulfoxide reductase heme-binding subunit YedZ [Gammaproteobacteria bacterium]|nr:sulfoxide reductase heme-binding subunit YedZ [Gammaproteobacteria bacterium]MBU2478304.1 sulfoxide reductase heme-binding subunit YedZ [Gammaproteobacteria bacterium]
MKPWIKPVIFILCLLPLAWLIFALLTDQLGANPIEELTRETGEWTLRLLLITLCMTPLRGMFGWTWPLRVRRMLGLFAFFYVCVHLTTYIWLDQFFDWNEILRDIYKRRFITVGMLAFVLLLPLALTSTNAMMKRLGKNWKRLHQLVYVIPALGVLHFWWVVKADVRAPLVYAVILVLLLAVRTERGKAWLKRDKTAAIA